MTYRRSTQDELSFHVMRIMMTRGVGEESTERVRYHLGLSRERKVFSGQKRSTSKTNRFSVSSFLFSLPNKYWGYHLLTVHENIFHICTELSTSLCPFSLTIYSINTCYTVNAFFNLKTDVRNIDFTLRTNFNNIIFFFRTQLRTSVLGLKTDITSFSFKN